MHTHMSETRATNLLEQIPQVGDGLGFFIHSARCPYARVARLNHPVLHYSFTTRIPLLFTL